MSETKSHTKTKHWVGLAALVRNAQAELDRELHNDPEGTALIIAKGFWERWAENYVRMWPGVK